ncbi:MAG TPA: TAXI family TRAP transporter solute-binding subunit [Casimicrobiaceae bacterium]|nr:TAXI family TRAP transporter solute-binding subunit [Casimicrobiaceae bacterium]
MSRLVNSVITPAALALATSFVSLDTNAQQHVLTWSAGQPSGGWYKQAGGLVDLIKSKDARFDIKVVPGAAYANMTKLQQGETEIAWSLPPVIAASYNGETPFTSKQTEVRLLMTGLGSVSTHIAVAADVPARSLREIFESKQQVKIGSPAPGGSDEWELRKILEFYKTTYDDMRSRGVPVVFGSFRELVGKYSDGTVDMFLLNNSVPSTDVQEASRVRPLRILTADEDLVIYLAQFGITRSIIPAGSYKDVVNNNVDIATIGMTNTIVTSAKVSSNVIYDFTRTLLGNVEALREIDPAFKDFDPRNAVKLANVPLHPGAEKAYREAGLIR